MIFVDVFLRSLGYRLARLTDLELVSYGFKFFDDGEFYLRVMSDVSGRDVFVVLGMFPDPSFSVVRGLFYVGTLKELGAKKVYIIAPYLAYSRQDKRFLSGECVSSRLVVGSLIRAGADKVVTIDVHSEEAFTEYGDSFVNLESKPVIRDFIVENYDKNDIFLLSPDKGRMDSIASIADEIGVPNTTFVKVRDLKTGNIVKHEPLDKGLLKELIEEKHVVILLDDIISTGGTISSIVRQLRQTYGFKGKVVSIFTHGLFLPGSIRKLYESGVSEIVATDTVDNPFNVISVAPVIRDFITNTLK